MACKEDRYTLGDRTYYIRQMPPRLALKVEAYLVKMVGQPLFKAFSTKGFNLEATTAVALGAFADRLDDEELLKAMYAVFRFVGIDGVCVRVCEESDHACEGIDKNFQGRNKELLQVFIQALRVNFNDFFAGLPSLSTVWSRMRGLITLDSQTSTPGSFDPSSQTPSSATTSEPSMTGASP